MKKRQSIPRFSGNSAKSSNSTTHLLQRFLILTVLSIFCLVFIGASGSFPFAGTLTALAQPKTPTDPRSENKTASNDKVSPEAARQIAALLREKETRTSAERKIDSQILYKIRMTRGQLIAEGIPELETDLTVDDDGGIAVEIRANVTDELLRTLVDMNAIIIDSSPRYRSVTARLPIDGIEALAGMREVIFIQPHFEANFWQTQKAPTNDLPLSVWQDDYPQSFFRTQRSSSFEDRVQRVREFLTEQLNPTPEVGSQNSQGDATHQANTVRSTIGPNGVNIKIGVISNGVVSLAASQALGDLPANVTILTGQRGTGDEGTAMLEIVHDLAPGAQLFYATANPTIARFAQNIRDLRTADCDIIIDDVFYFVESPFHDGQIPAIISNTNGAIVTQAVNDVTADGALYFSSAGNQGNVDDITASAYQSDFVNGGALALTPGGTVHNFGGGAQFDLVSAASGNQTNLYWADPLGGSVNDYDLFTLNPAGTAVTSSSTNLQTGTQDPFEATAAAAVNSRIVVLKKTGAADRFFLVTTNANGAGRLGTSTPGTTKGHSMAANAYSVAATPAQAPGPFPGAFNSANTSETFTSDGPRRIFFNPTGTAITPGNFSSTGGLLRQKPDITAADGVSVTGVGGFPTTFFGTSAAAPHAGAIAALIKSAQPTITGAQMRTALTTTAIDIETAGVDRNTGAGIVMPLAALTSLGITSGIPIISGTQTTTEAAPYGNGNGRLEIGERGNLLIPQLSNIGLANATSVQATLSTTTPNVNVLTPGPISFGTINAASVSAANTTPFTFRLAGGFACGTPINFVSTVTFTGGPSSPQLVKFTVNTEAAPVTIASTIDAAPPANPAYVATSGTQTNRVTRNGLGSVCSGTKPAPGITAAVNPRYHAYRFTAASTGCATVTFSSTGGATAATQLFVTAYNNAGFVPAAINTNYLADNGSSAAQNVPLGFAFNVTAGQQYTVVVAEVTPGGATGVPYTLTITGPPVTACNFNPTAAAVSVGGRVLTADGRGVVKARVYLTDQNGVRRSAITSPFGYYSFADLQAGETYILEVSSKRYTFASRTVTLNDELTDLDFIAGP